MKPLPTNPDVVVVGAGTAGLSAAKALKADGLDVIILEAASHVGGRCVTDTSLFDTPFDKGGSWLHSAEINPLARIAERNGIGVFKTPWECDGAHTDGRSLSGEDLKDYRRYGDAMWDRIKAAGKGPRDATPASVLPASPWQGMAKHWVAQMQGGDADVTSVTDVSRYGDAEGDWLVDGGLGAFVQALHADVAVQLDCPVLEIDTTGPGVRVVTPKGTLEAKQLVLTVSTGVLAAEAIRFVPALPTAKLAAIEQLPNGLLNKVGLEFDPAWQEAHEGQSVDYLSSDGAFCTLCFGFYGTSLAVGFVAGQFADHLEAEGPGAATEFCLQGLRATFGEKATKNVRRTAETAWRSNAHTAGSYSFARPGGADARKVLAEPIGGKLFFAGEATMPDAYATVHGAYLSGIRVAQEMAATRR